VSSLRPSWIVSSVALAVLTASRVFTPDSLPSIPVCGFRRMTGLPCAGCGMTRACCCIAHGDFARAWSFHPFAFLVFGAACIALAWPFVERFAPRARVGARWVLAAWFATAVAIFAYGALRIWRALHGAVLEL
jgi:hypothetical protein